MAVDTDSDHPYVDVDWHDILWQIVWTIVAQVALMLVSLPSKELYLSEESRSFRRWIKRRCGTASKPPKISRLQNTFYVLQFICSSITCILWIRKSYIQSVPDWMVPVENVTSFTVVVHYCFNVLKHNFSMSYICGIDGVLDVVTVSPLLTQGYHRCWLSFSFLRSWRVVMAYIRLEKTGFLDTQLSELARGVIIALVKFTAFVFTLAAMVFMLEVLGDPRGLVDKGVVHTAMGDISVYKMVYWIITTVSTVGYGEFSPTNMLSQAFIAIIIPGGVVFFTIITGELLEVRHLSLTGRGKFTPTSQNGHIVILGGAVTSDSPVTIRAFLEEVLHPVYLRAAPDVVLMSSHSAPDSLHHLVQEPWTHGKVRWLRGHPVESKDWERAHMSSADMVFILADIFTSNASNEDKNNALMASTCLKQQPSIHLTLMILQPENRELAVNLGVAPTRCFAINEIKAGFIAQSCSCPGFGTVMLNMCKQEVAGLDPIYRRTLPNGKPNPALPSWLDEFLVGASRDLYGCQLDTRFCNIPFREAARRIFDETNIVMIAVQIGGKLILGPMEHVVTYKDVVFVAAEHMDTVAHIQPPGAGRNDWKQDFKLRPDTKEYEMSPNFVSPLPARPGSTGSSSRTGSRPGSSAGSRGGTPGSSRGGTPGSGGRRASTASFKLLPHLRGEGASFRKSQFRQSVFVRQQNQQAALERSRSGRDSSKARPSLQPTIESKSAGQDCSDVGLLDSICTVGGHLLIFAQDDTTWQTVGSMLTMLRGPHLANMQAVVVLSPSTAPPVLANAAFSNVVYVQGDAHKINTLLRIGVDVAATIVILAGRPSGIAELEMDRETIVSASLVEKIHEHFNHTGTVVLDLHSLSNVCQLFYDIPPSYMSLRYRQKMEKFMQKRQDSEAPGSPRQKVGRMLERYLGVPAGTPPSQGAPAAAAAAAPPDAWKENDHMKAAWLEPGVHEDVMERDIINLHPRFAAGRVLSRADIVRFFAFSFYTPGCLEVVEAFADPERRGQRSAMHLMPLLVEFWGQSVGALVHALLDENIMLVALYRENSAMKDNLTPYIFSFPTPDVVLGPTDRIYVVADMDWVNTMNMRNVYEHQAASKIAAIWRKRDKLRRDRVDPRGHSENDKRAHYRNANSVATNVVSAFDRLAAADGTLAADGATSPPASGATTPPASGATTPPASGATTPPAHRATTPPASGATTPPTDGSTSPAAGAAIPLGDGAVLNSAPERSRLAAPSASASRLPDVIPPPSASASASGCASASGSQAQPAPGHSRGSTPEHAASRPQPPAAALRPLSPRSAGEPGPSLAKPPLPKGAVQPDRNPFPTKPGKIAPVVLSSTPTMAQKEASRTPAAVPSGRPDLADGSTLSSTTSAAVAESSFEYPPVPLTNLHTSTRVNKYLAQSPTASNGHSSDRQYSRALESIRLRFAIDRHRTWREWMMGGWAKPSS